MYTTSDIANFLNTNRQNVNYYIRKGYLEAVMIDGEYKITQQSYFSFRDKYFDTNKRNKNRGITKKLSDEQIELLSLIIKDIKDNSLTFDDFKEKYKNKEELIPQIKDFIIYKRDRCIRYDNDKKGYRYKKLSLIYGLKEITIRKIVSETKKRSNFNY